eukprot:528958-Hanusia_phi.AAC.1
MMVPGNQGYSLPLGMIHCASTESPTMSLNLFLVPAPISNCTHSQTVVLHRSRRLTTPLHQLPRLSQLNQHGIEPVR